MQYLSHHATMAMLGKAKHGKVGPDGKPEADTAAIDEDIAGLLMQQGAAIALGKFFHGKLPSWHAERAAIENNRTIGQLPEARALINSRNQFFGEAEALGKSGSPDPNASIALLARYEQVAQFDRIFRHRVAEVEHTANVAAALRAQKNAAKQGAKNDGHGAAPSHQAGDSVVNVAKNGPAADIDGASTHAAVKTAAAATPTSSGGKTQVPAAHEAHSEPTVKHKGSANRIGEPVLEAPSTQVPKNRVSEAVPGLFESIDPQKPPAGWHLSDRDGVHRHPDHPGWLQVTTDVVAPDGSQGWIERSFDSQTKILVMENAFLSNLPKWLDSTVAMVEGRGTPTVAYLTMRQMKLMDASFGKLTTVKMSTIQNIEAVMQLEQLRRRGMPLDQAVRQTHSVAYATTSIQQSGHSVNGVVIDTAGSFEWVLGDMMDHFGMPASERSRLFALYELGSNDSMLVNYDIRIDVGPQAPNAKGKQ
jgi:hypothetical protein